MTHNTPFPTRGAGPCIICASINRQVVYWKWGYPSVRCNDCGLGSADVAEFDSTSLYNDGYFKGKVRDGYADYAGSEAVLRSEFRRTVADLRAHGRHGWKLLEVGCAYGFFLLEAAKYYDCVGIDISHDAIAAARARGLNAQCGLVNEEFLRNTGPFDVVVMLDVIEHLPDPCRTLSMIRGSIKPDGQILITTGDWGSLLAKILGRHWRLMTPPPAPLLLLKTKPHAVVEQDRLLCH